MNPRVLVAVASRHGSTLEMADRLAVALATAPEGVRTGTTAVAQRVERDPDPTRFTAVVVASAVYAGRWEPPARQWVTRHLPALRSRPVWLLSSGPIGDPPFPEDEAHDVGPLRAELRARGARTLPGRLDPQRLGPGERAVVVAMRAPVGDSRDWAALESWAAEITRELTATTGSTARP